MNFNCRFHQDLYSSVQNQRGASQSHKLFVQLQQSVTVQWVVCNSRLLQVYPAVYSYSSLQQSNELSVIAGFIKKCIQLCTATAVCNSPMSCLWLQTFTSVSSCVQLQQSATVQWVVCDCRLLQVYSAVYSYSSLQQCNELSVVAGFIKKCIQLYETTEVRHGLMLVGPTVSGKTRVRDSMLMSFLCQCLICRHS